MIEHSTNVNANCTIKKAIVSILGDDARVFFNQNISNSNYRTVMNTDRVLSRCCYKECWHTADLIIWALKMNETHNKISNKDPHFSVNECRLITLLRQPDLRTPFSTLQTLSGSLSHRLSNTVNIEAAAGPPTLNSHCFSSCCPTTLLHRRYRQSPPVGRRRRAKLTRSNRHIQASGNVA